MLNTAVYRDLEAVMPRYKLETRLHFVLFCIFKLDVTHSAMKLASFVSLIEMPLARTKHQTMLLFLKF